MTEKPKLLLHCCCAPCSVYVAPSLKEKFEITCFFYNPNIDIPEEYEKRKAEMATLSQKIEIPVIFGKYDTERWRKNIEGLEKEKEGGARCEICFKIRLEECAKEAQAKGFDFFATTLTVAPMKNAPLINEIGEKCAQNKKVSYMPSDFKKNDGYKKSVHLSMEFGLYRQNFCGCSYGKIQANIHKLTKSEGNLKNNG